MDVNQVINTVAAGGICACATILFQMAREMAGFREWRKHVDRKLAAHDRALDIE